MGTGRIKSSTAQLWPVSGNLPRTSGMAYLDSQAEGVRRGQARVKFLSWHRRWVAQVGRVLLYAPAEVQVDGFSLAPGPRAASPQTPPSSTQAQQ